MTSNRHQTRRILAVFLLITFLQSIVLPPMAHALTSGPTAPEATSFEPVDATDMVNLMTGDFTYSIPLLEVPGPEGGYPLALSYHAGIKPLEDASWVGLGWSLNPGAINRMVNGYPDDQYQADRKVTDYWAGGETNSYSVGVGFGVPGGATFNLGYSWSNDTYKGFNGDASMGVSIGIGPLGVGVNVSTSGVSSANAGLGIGSVSVGKSWSTHADGSIGATIGLGPVSASVQMTNGSTTNGVTGNIGLSSGLIGMGVNISSKGLKPSISIAGAQIQTSNNGFGNISTIHRSTNIPFLWFNYSHNYTRYWMHEKDQVKVTGSLHASEFDDLFATNCGGLLNDVHAFDKLALPDRDFGSNPVKLAGSLPATDSYQVSAQGLSGSIKPFYYNSQVPLIGKDVKKKAQDPTDPDILLKSYKKLNTLNYNSTSVKFRFVNDFSNKMTGTVDDLEVEYSTCPFVVGNAAFDFTTEGFNNSEKFLAGSKHVEWFSNDEINNGTALSKGFMNFPGISISERESFMDYDIKEQIGGYSITNESGVTYHYGLPVYAYEEYSSSEISSAENNDGGDVYNRQENFHPYASSWLLTAITGPDYIDRGGVNSTGDGKLGENDWGYWVEFDYGKWADDYRWRTPGIGTHTDIDGRVRTFSYGKKQLYYLDLIKTRTHTAIFVKDMRFDGKGIKGRDGGWGFNDNISGDCIVTGFDMSKSQLKLDEILLFKNKDFNSITSIFNLRMASQSYNYSFDYQQMIDCGSGPTTLSTETAVIENLDENVIDKFDIQSLGSSLDAIVQRKIILQTDYSLSPGTINSFDNDVFYSANYQQVETKGKLTLNSMKYLGKNGANILPPINFDYGNKVGLNHSFDIYPIGDAIEIGGISTVEEEEWVGELIKIENNGIEYNLMLTEFINTTSSGKKSYRYKVLGENLPFQSFSGLSQIKTKNPPFNKDNFDVWGYYKSDFSEDELYPSGGILRMPTVISCKSTDAWSLREIETSLGGKIKIEYEPKTFSQLGFTNKKEVLRCAVTPQTSAPGDTRIYFSELEDPSLLFKESDYIFLTTEYGSASPQIQTNGFVIDNVVTPSTGNGYIEANIPGIVEANKGFVSFQIQNLSDPIVCFAEGNRVKKIKVVGTGQESITCYEYSNAASSYLPTSHKRPKVPLNNNDNLYGPYFQAYNQTFGNVIVKGQFAPAPGVMHGTVKVSEESNGITLPSSKKYHFTLFDPSMIDLSYSYDSEVITDVFYGAANIVIKDKTTQIGSLKQSEVFDGNDHLLRRTKMYYNTNSSQHNNQGRIDQVFLESWAERSSAVTNTNDPFNHYAQKTKLEEYPEYLEKSETTEFDITTTSYNRKYDFYSGEATTIESENSHGEKFRSEVIAAYHKYPNMGLKVNTPSNKHMLTQNAYTQNYRITDFGSNGTFDGLLDANITTWDDESADYRVLVSANGSLPERYQDESSTQSDNIWRKEKTYIFKGDVDPDGTIPYLPNSTNQDFNWTTNLPNSGSNWLLGGETTRYDHYSRPLEAKDNRGYYIGAAKMGYDETLVLATTSNSKYTEMYYSGAEDLISGTNWFGGEVRTASVNGQDNTHAHTGDYSLRVESGFYGFTILARVDDDVYRGKDYRAQVWVKDNGDLANTKLVFYYLNSSGEIDPSMGQHIVYGDAYTIKAGDWVLLGLDMEVNPNAVGGRFLIGTTHNISSNDIYLDDFRFFPLDGNMTSYVYDQQTDQVRFILNSENMYTEYQYDDAGRLNKVYQETTENPTGKRLVSEHEINYARPD